MRKLVVLLTVVFAVACFVADGAILIYNDTWDGAETWSAIDFATETAPAEATIIDPDTVGGQSALGINATTGGAPGDDLIFANDTTIAGDKNWSDGTGMPGGQPVTVSIMFDFYSDQASTAISLYFRNDIGGADVYWYYDFAVTGTGWSSSPLTAGMSFGSGWYAPALGGGNSTQFNAALEDVDQVGIQLSYQPNASQAYGIDNFQLYGGFIPEPGTYSMLGFAFLSLGVTFRKRLKDYWAQMMAQIKG